MKRIFYLLFLLLNIVAALLLLASSLAGVIPPSKALVFSLLSYAFIPLLIVNIVFIVVWLLLGDWLFLISLAVIVARWSLIPLFYQVSSGHTTRQAGAPVVKVMTFNAHHFYGRRLHPTLDNLSQVDSNATLFLHLVEQESPDVLCLEEYLAYTGKVHISDSLQAMGYTYHAAATPQSNYSTTICWSRYPLANTVYIDSVIKMQTDLIVADDTLRLICLHLHSYRLDSTDLHELNRIQHGAVSPDSARGTLSKFKTAILGHEAEWHLLQPFITQSPYPVIVAGDFNDTPASYLYHQLRHLLDDSFVDCGKGFGTTYHGLFPNFRIDYILHSPQLQTLSYRRINTDISDHYPLIVELQLNTTTP